MIRGNAKQYKLFYTGNEKVLGKSGIFLTENLLDIIIEISSVSYSMAAIKILFKAINSSVISVCAS